MEILAGLVKFGDDNKLPLPWYNRPALGLKTGTPVYVAAVISNTPSRRGQGRVPPDIIITPLRYSGLHQTFSITIDLKEGKGAIGKVLDIISINFNIALMETVTIDQRQKHRITMILEPINMNNDEFIDINIMIIDLKKSLSAIEGIDIKPHLILANKEVKFEEGDISEVINGYVDITKIIDFINENYGDLKNKFDLKKLVISSNPDARFVRYIFPKIGVFQARISHEDLPTAMKTLTQTLGNLKYNILLSRISKSGSYNKNRYQKSETVLICEPIGKFNYGVVGNHARKIIKHEIYMRLKFADIGGKFSFRVDVDDISFGRSADSVIDIKYPFSNVRKIESPREISMYLDKYVDKGKNVIFVSLPAASTDLGNAKDIREIINKVVKELNCVVYDGFSSPSELSGLGRADEICARIWRADAGIFLAAGQETPQWLTRNQEIEWGFMRPICDKSIIICHPDTLPDRRFMMPDHSMITYTEMKDRGDLLKIEEEVRRRIKSWFNII